jgi:integrase
MSSALVSNGSRVFTPDEVKAIRSVISKPSLLALFNLLLYTGMRLSEVRQLVDNPLIFDKERKTILIVSGKTKATQKDRNILLNEKGLQAVRGFLKNPVYPQSPFAWQKNLIRWCRAAHLAELPNPDYESNRYGVTVRSTRKTWESWLMTCHEDKAVRIALSQGHKESTQIGHYLNLLFTDEEYNQICEEVSDWGMRNCRT